MTTGTDKTELTRLANEALRSQPGCETALVPQASAAGECLWRTQLGNSKCCAR